MYCPSALLFLGRTCDESMASIHSTSKLIPQTRGAMVVIWGRSNESLGGLGRKSTSPHMTDLT